MNGNALVVIPAESTVTEALPAAAIKVAETGAVSWPALTKVVVRAVPFQRTTAPDTKALPFTVSVKAGRHRLPRTSLTERCDRRSGGDRERQAVARDTSGKRRD